MSRIVESLYAKYDLADDELTIEVDDEVETEIIEEEPEIVEPEPEVEEIESEEEIIEEACGDKKDLSEDANNDDDFHIYLENRIDELFADLENAGVSEADIKDAISYYISFI